MAKNRPRRKKLIAEPLEPRLLFSATVDFALLDDGQSDTDYLLNLSETTDLTQVLDLDYEPYTVSDLALETSERSEFTGSLIFVDGSIEDYQSLVDDITDSEPSGEFQVIVIDADSEGVQAITDTLLQFTGVSAVHIVSHGNDGKLHLGNTRLTDSNVEEFSSDLRAWGESLSREADILIYGCDLAELDEGRALISSIADYTNADVAASDDVTGAEAYSGNWVLEYNIGRIETSTLFQNAQPTNWVGYLAGTVPAAVSDTVNVWFDEVIEGNVITGLGGDGMEADDLLDDAPGELVSVEYNSTVYSNWDGNDNLSISTSSGDLTVNKDGSYTFVSSYAATTEGTSDGSWADNFSLYGYNLGNEYHDNDTITVATLALADATISFTSSGLAINGPADSVTDLEELSDDREVIVVDTGITDSEQFTLTLSRLNSSEEAKWRAYDSAGIQVGSGTFLGTDSGESSDYTEFTVDVGTDFQYVAIMAESTTADFRVYSLSVADVKPDDLQFTYVVADNDNDTDSAFLDIIFAADNQIGAVTFSGTETEGETLTANVYDEDGTENSTISYQWERSTDADNWSIISGADTSSYTLTNDDAGQYIRLNTQYVDDQGTIEDRNSEYSDVITAVNDTPILVNNTLTVIEGGTTVLDPTNFSASDIDDDNTTLSFSVSNVSNGEFRLVSDDAIVTNFSQQQIIDGEIKFVHDGSEASPSFDLSVADDDMAATTPVATTITFSNVNDAPTFVVNGFTLNEGGSVVLNNTNIQASDTDDTDNILEFNVVSVSNGSFQLVSDDSVVTNFTQDEIDTGQIKFVHDGSELAPSYSLTVEDDEGTTSAVTAGVITFANVNDAPTIDSSTGSIQTEDVALEGDIVARFTASDLDGDTITFTITNGNAAGYFELLDPSSGVVTLSAAGQVALANDSLTSADYILGVTASDGRVESAEATAIISFEAINDAPIIDTATGSIQTENMAVEGDVVARFIASDLDSDVIIFAITSGNDAGYFELLDNTSGELTLTAAGAAALANNSLTDADYLIGVTASDGSVDSDEATTTISFAGVNDIPTIDTATGSIQTENVAVEGDLVARFTANDLDGDAITFTITSGNIDGYFEILDPSSGDVTLTAAGEAALASDDLTDTDYILGVTANDGLVNSVEASATIRFGGVNDTPVIDTARGSVQIENIAAEGDLVAIFTASDSDGDSTTFAITSGNTEGYFEILDASSGDVTLTAAGEAALANNTLTDTDYLLGVTVNDGTLDSIEATATISFVGANDIPIINSATGSVQTENIAVEGDLVASFTASDLDGDGITFSITSGNAAGYFEILDNTLGEVTLTAVGEAALSNDALTDTDYVLGVTASDGTLDSEEAIAIISFEGVNDIPTIAVNTITVNEGASVTLSAANIFASDDASNTLTFTVVSVSNASFQLVSDDSIVNSFTQDDIDNGRIKFVHDGSETAPSFSLTVADLEFISDESIGSVIFSANDNDAPVLVGSIDALQTYEDELFEFTIPSTLFTDVDDTSLSYIAQQQGGGDLPSWLSFDSISGVFTGTPQQENLGELNLEVIAVDAQGAQSAAAPMALSILAVNDIPTLIDGGNIQVLEDAEDSVVDLSEYFADEEDLSADLSFSVVEVSNSALFDQATIDTEAELRLAYSSNAYGAGTVTIRATDSGGLSIDKVFSVDVLAVNDLPTAMQIGDIVQSENSVSDTVIDLSVLFDDAEDPGSLTFNVEYIGNTQLVNAYEIDVENQRLTLHYATAQHGSSEVIIRATDSDGGIVDLQFKTIVNVSPTLPVEPEPEPEVEPEPNDNSPEEIEPEPEPSLTPSEPLVDIPVRGDNVLIVDSLEAINVAPVITFDTGIDSEELRKERNEEYAQSEKSAEEATQTESNLANLISIAGINLDPVETEQFNHELRLLKQDMQLAEEEAVNEELFFNSLKLSFTTGALVWGLRAGGFLMTLFSAFPIYRGLDPLPVISAETRKSQKNVQDKDKLKEDKHSREVGHMFDQKN